MKMLAHTQPTLNDQGRSGIPGFANRVVDRLKNIKILADNSIAASMADSMRLLFIDLLTQSELKKDIYPFSDDITRCFDGGNSNSLFKVPELEIPQEATAETFRILTVKILKEIFKRTIDREGKIHSEILDVFHVINAEVDFSKRKEPEPIDLIRAVIMAFCTNKNPELSFFVGALLEPVKGKSILEDVYEAFLKGNDLSGDEITKIINEDAEYLRVKGSFNPIVDRFLNPCFTFEEMLIAFKSNQDRWWVMLDKDGNNLAHYAARNDLSLYNQLENNLANNQDEVALSYFQALNSKGEFPAKIMMDKKTKTQLLLNSIENSSTCTKFGSKQPLIHNSEKISQDSPSVKAILSTKEKVQRIMFGGSLGALVLGGGSLACTIAFGAAFGVTGLSLIALGPIGWVIGGVAIAGFIAGALVAKETYRSISLESTIQSPEGTTKPSLEDAKKDSHNSPTASAQTLFAPSSQVQQPSAYSNQLLITEVAPT